jgi:THO complex subunit 1 transcription elongation factor
MEELEGFYLFFSGYLTRLSVISEKIDNYSVVKIFNDILKRLSRGTYTELRGKVQTLLAGLNSINNKSGLNKKSVINDTSFQGLQAEHTSIGNATEHLTSIYHNFWEHLPNLANPFIHSDESSTQAKKEPVVSLVRGMKKLLDYFKNNPIEEEEPIIPRFPKYIKDLRLFTFQINEPYFRKTVLIQLRFLLFNLEHPLRVFGKTLEPFTEAEKKEVNELDQLLTHLMEGFKPIKHEPKRNLHDIISRVLISEKDWMKWKEEGCQPYTQCFKNPSEILDKFRNSESLVDTTGSQNLVTEKSKKMREWLSLDKYTNDYMASLNKSYLSVCNKSIQKKLEDHLELLFELEQKEDSKNLLMGKTEDDVRLEISLEIRMQGEKISILRLDGSWRAQ